MEPQTLSPFVRNNAIFKTMCRAMINEAERVLRADDDDMTCSGPGQLVMYGNRKMGKYGMARQHSPVFPQ